MLLRLYGWLLFFLCGTAAMAQKVTYTQPEKDDYKTTEFEIIGKVGGQIMVYKSDRGDYAVSIYDNNLQPVQRIPLDFLPKKLLSMDLVAYSDRVLFFYQFQRKDAVFSFCATMHANGSFDQAPLLLDSTRIGNVTVENKVYSVQFSEDKSKILLYKINQDRQNDNIFYTFLYDSSMLLINNSRVSMPMETKKHFLGNFSLSNEGDFIFTKLERSSNRDVMVAGQLVQKQATVDSFALYPFDLKGQLVDEVKVKLDNVAKRVITAAFYYKQKRGNVEGLYINKFDYGQQQPVYEKFADFSQQLKASAKGDASTAGAFNDYFIRRIVNLKNGGFLVTAECFYTTSRYQPYNRWNYLYGPYGGMYPYYYSPYSSMYNPWFYNNGPQGNRFHNDNVAVLSYDEEGNLQWSNIVNKSQFDDGSDMFLSYIMVNVGSELRFLFNEADRRNWLVADNSITPDGKISRLPTLRNLDKGYTWMPRFGKQIGARTVLIPCVYRNYICFAKIDF
ncbi:hypothetical protein GA0116948_103207 [Chitinophaga costaii]|uniref:Uncharacterized protein n=1 Tax=Chitinophaga costaii TaxID=1335309 RepID=A0A1C4BQ68_9BACT|nr:hypothetical protein [Chitinophaga costaii]SCC09007.1 hypothetical protein GA0116948_103207 [Chitinophaga costaii]